MKPINVGVEKTGSYDVEPRTGKPFSKLGYKLGAKGNSQFRIPMNKKFSLKPNLPCHDAYNTKDGNWQDNIGTNIKI
jgi:hypothetical protein